MKMPVCPYCGEEMARVHWQLRGDGGIVVWLCGCKFVPEMIVGPEPETVPDNVESPGPMPYDYKGRRW